LHGFDATRAWRDVASCVKSEETGCAGGGCVADHAHNRFGMGGLGGGAATAPMSRGLPVWKAMRSLG